MPEKSALLEWYRADATAAVVRVVVLGSALVMCGVVCVGLCLSGAGGGQVVNVLLGVVGALCTLAGPGVTILGFQRVLSQDVYLAVRREGLAFHDGGTEQRVSWDDLVEARSEGDPPRLTLVRRAEAPLHLPVRFDGVDAPELARRLNQVRRRALMNLLR